MIKIKQFIIVALVAGVIYACSGSGGETVEEFDHAAQAVIDNDSLVKFLTNHYYDMTKDSIKPLKAGETALIDDVKLKTKDVVENEIDFKLYYYVINEGTPDPVKGFPTIMDSVLTSYRGVYLDNTTDEVSFESNLTTWFTLAGVVRGWTESFIHFKGGKNITNNGPITFENHGKGIVFIPSGLGYRNLVQGNIPENSSLIFYFDLLDIKEDTDHDIDGVPSIFEDPDGDGNPLNDDTDEDGTANFLDNDDDGDGVPTIKEDANNDGDPRNDFSDPANPNLPDYLNPNIK